MDNLLKDHRYPIPPFGRGWPPIRVVPHRDFSQKGVVWDASVDVNLYIGFMNDRARIIADLEHEIVALLRREMRLRDKLASALVSPDQREAARRELEELMKDLRQTQERLSDMKAER